MKLLLLSVVLVGLIGASKQQNAAAVRPFVLLNRPHYMPLFYVNGLPAGYDVVGNNIQNEQRNVGIAGRRVTLTTTVQATVTNTITTVNTVNCVPASQVVNGTNATACASRRRRDIELIHPDQPKSVETTALVSDSVPIPAQPDILSSKEDGGINYPMLPLMGRAFTMATVTNLITVNSFVPTVISNTKNLGAANGLLCVPAGYVVCATVASAASNGTSTGK